MCRSAVNDGSFSPWVMCSYSVVRGNQFHDKSFVPHLCHILTLKCFKLVTVCFAVAMPVVLEADH